MASIDQRGERAWRARVRVPGFNTKTRTFDTKIEAAAWALRIERELRAGVDTVINYVDEPTLGDALGRYRRQITPEKKGWKQEAQRIAAWQARPLATLKLSRIGVQHFVEFRDGRLASGLSGNTVRLELALISHLYNVARVEWGMPYLKNPIENLRPPKISRSRDRRLNAHEAARFTAEVAACRNTWIAPLIGFALETAARRGELIRLTWGDVDLARRVMILRDTKNGSDRHVPLSQAALAILTRLERSPDGSVFPISFEALSSAWRRIVTRARIDNFRFHDLRHEATTRLTERGLGVMHVQQITGHKTLAMLLRYTQLNVSGVVQRLDATEPPTPPWPTGPSPLPPNVLRFPSRT